MVFCVLRRLREQALQIEFCDNQRRDLDLQSVTHGEAHHSRKCGRETHVPGVQMEQAAGVEREMGSDRSHTGSGKTLT